MGTGGEGTEDSSTGGLNFGTGTSTRDDQLPRMRPVELGECELTEDMVERDLCKTRSSCSSGFIDTTYQIING